MQLAAIDVSHAFDRASEVHQAVAPQYLARTRSLQSLAARFRAPPREPALDRHCLPGVQPDPDRKGQIRRGPRRLEEANLQVDRRPDGLTRRAEHGERLVTSSSTTDPLRSWTCFRTMSANVAASRAAASSPRSCVKTV